MKNFGKLAVLGAVLAVSSSFAFADTITLASFGLAGNGVNNSGVNPTNGEMQIAGYNASTTTPTSTGIASGNAFDLNPLTTWALPLGNTNSSLYTISPASGPDSVWVGATAAAGPGPGDIAPPAGYYTFTTQFSAVGGAYNGSIDVMADDTVAVYLNGGLTPIINFSSPGSDNHCEQNVPNCSGEDNVLFSNLTLNNGINTLYFVVDQTSVTGGGGNGSSGLDLNGSLTAVPEPSSLMLLGTGLVGAAGMLYRRRQTV